MVKYKVKNLCKQILITATIWSFNAQNKACFKSDFFTSLPF